MVQLGKTLFLSKTLAYSMDFHFYAEEAAAQYSIRRKATRFMDNIRLINLQLHIVNHHHLSPVESDHLHGPAIHLLRLQAVAFPA